MKTLALLLTSFVFSASAMAATPPAKAKADASVKPAAQLPLPAQEKIIVAAGCFWGVEDFFRKKDGVISTQVGYSGGTADHPTYPQVSGGRTGHAESVEITYDPKKISTDQLLTWFFKMHDPTTLNRQGNDEGTQYRSAIFYENEEQKQAAEKLKARVDASHAWKAPIMTEIKPATKFYPAEDYHQKYLVKNPGGYDNHYVRNINF